VVGRVEAWRSDAELLRDGAQELFLCERLVVGDVVGLAGRARVVGGQEESLYDVGHIHEREGVTTGADDEAFAGAHALGHAPEVQAIAGPKERARPDDGGWQV